ncbi:hypothetical protein CBR_g26271 [Chara braunii]|uniref:Uncharacterized protein n=1 Tax=Chara braunii TaxID=69332 RepID=A0A388L7I3_CHABU|nr:hypothetical protein CBR_g26271 [Chara braunii]|eukprot:GBG78238.1 hypothetical protein CBR_g26271 [Chara braunii]
MLDAHVERVFTEAGIDEDVIKRYLPSGGRHYDGHNHDKRRRRLREEDMRKTVMDGGSDDSDLHQEKRPRLGEKEQSCAQAAEATQEYQMIPRASGVASDKLVVERATTEDPCDDCDRAIARLPPQHVNILGDSVAADDSRLKSPYPDGSGRPNDRHTSSCNAIKDACDDCDGVNGRLPPEQKNIHDNLLVAEDSSVKSSSPHESGRLSGNHACDRDAEATDGGHLCVVDTAISTPSPVPDSSDKKIAKKECHSPSESQHAVPGLGKSDLRLQNPDTEVDEAEADNLEDDTAAVSSSSSRSLSLAMTGTASPGQCNKLSSTRSGEGGTNSDDDGGAAFARDNGGPPSLDKPSSPASACGRECTENETDKMDVEDDYAASKSCAERAELTKQQECDDHDGQVRKTCGQEHFHHHDGEEKVEVATFDMDFSVTASAGDCTEAQCVHSDCDDEQAQRGLEHTKGHKGEIGVGEDMQFEGSATESLLDAAAESEQQHGVPDQAAGCDLEGNNQGDTEMVEALDESGAELEAGQPLEPRYERQVLSQESTQSLGPKALKDSVISVSPACMEGRQQETTTRSFAVVDADDGCRNVVPTAVNDVDSATDAGGSQEAIAHSVAAVDVDVGYGQEGPGLIAHESDSNEQTPSAATGNELNLNEQIPGVAIDNCQVPCAVYDKNKQTAGAAIGTVVTVQNPGAVIDDEVLGQQGKQSTSTATEESYAQEQELLINEGNKNGDAVCVQISASGVSNDFHQSAASSSASTVLAVGGRGSASAMEIGGSGDGSDDKNPVRSGNSKRRIVTPARFNMCSPKEQRQMFSTDDRSCDERREEHGGNVLSPAPSGETSGFVTPKSTHRARQVSSRSSSAKPPTVMEDPVSVQMWMKAYLVHKDGGDSEWRIIFSLHNNSQHKVVVESLTYWQTDEQIPPNDFVYSTPSSSTSHPRASGGGDLEKERSVYIANRLQPTTISWPAGDQVMKESGFVFHAVMMPCTPGVYDSPRMGFSWKYSEGGRRRSFGSEAGGGAAGETGRGLGAGGPRGETGRGGGGAGGGAVEGPVACGRRGWHALSERGRRRSFGSEAGGGAGGGAAGETGRGLGAGGPRGETGRSGGGAGGGAVEGARGGAGAETGRGRGSGRGRRRRSGRTGRRSGRRTGRRDGSGAMVSEEEWEKEGEEGRGEEQEKQLEEQQQEEREEEQEGEREKEREEETGDEWEKERERGYGGIFVTLFGGGGMRGRGGVGGAGERAGGRVGGETGRGGGGAGVGG